MIAVQRVTHVTGVHNPWQDPRAVNLAEAQTPRTTTKVQAREYLLEGDDESDSDDEGEERVGGCRWWLVHPLPCRNHKELDTSNHDHHWNPPNLPARKDRVSDWKDVDWSHMQMQDYYTEYNDCEYNLGPEDELPFHKWRSQIKEQHDFIKQQVDSFKKAGNNPDNVLAWRRVLSTPGFISLETQWSELTPQEFVRNLVATEAFKQQKEYLDSLAIPVDSETLHQFRVIPKCRQKQYSGVAVRITKTDKMWSEQGHNPDFTMQSFANRGFLKSPPRVFYRFAYTSAGKIFSADTQSNAYMVKAMLEAGPNSGIFMSVVGRALEDSIWMDCEPVFFLSRLVDFVYLMALSSVGYRLRQDRTMMWPSYLVLWFCFLKSLTVMISETAMLTYQYGVRHFLDKWLTPWNVTMFPAEAFSLLSIFVFLTNSNPEDEEPFFLRKHPVWLSFVCGAKWFEFLISCLCIRSLGLNVLPAVNAMFSKESLWFLVFVLACVGADFGDYYMYPIPENFSISRNATDWKAMFAQEGWMEFVFGIMKIFRLDIMGDFDLWELEGLDEEIKSTGAWNQTKLRNDTEVAYVDEPHMHRPYTGWHYGIRVFFMTSCLLIHLMLLNVYIGLLTKTYENRASKKRQLLAEFRMVFALRQLLLRLPAALLRSRLGMLPFQQKSSAAWISYDPELFRIEAYGLKNDRSRGAINDPEGQDQDVQFY